LKPGSVKEPESYLGSQVSKFYIDSADDPEKPRWAMSSEKYVKQAVTDVETELVEINQFLPTKVTTPFHKVTDRNWIHLRNLIQGVHNTINH
jgi:hypothetical protein